MVTVLSTSELTPENVPQAGEHSELWNLRILVNHQSDSFDRLAGEEITSALLESREFNLN